MSYFKSILLIFFISYFSLSQETHVAKNIETEDNPYIQESQLPTEDNSNSLNQPLTKEDSGAFVNTDEEREKKKSKMKFRARQMYEFHTLEINGKQYRYQGFSNSFDYWYEVPYQYSIGLALGPLLGGSSNSRQDETDPEVGDKITISFLGIEGKYFIYNLLYLRGGFGWTPLKVKNSESSKSGFFTLLGVGYEFVPKEGFGIATEIDFRKGIYEDNITIDTVSPSIGFHFYKYF